jgi:hypothetical protein
MTDEQKRIVALIVVTVLFFSFALGQAEDDGDNVSIETILASQ